MRDHGDGSAPKPLWRGMVDELLDLVAPSRCAGCGAICREPFCPDCADAVEYLDGPYCPVCGAPYPPSAGGWPVCAQCRRHSRLRLDGARAVGLHTGPLRQAVIGLKFKGHQDLVEPLGQILARRFKSEPARTGRLPFDNVDAIVPVVLHPLRRKWRGFDQAVLLARQVSALCHKRLWDDVLERVKNTAPQVDLDLNRRADNVKGAFEARKAWKLKDSSVLMIDDVVTTGATLREAAKALKRAGAVGVYALTVTCAVPDWHPASLPTMRGDT